jgi:uncharacterized coiled-coil protein SlyX
MPDNKVIRNKDGGILAFHGSDPGCTFGEVLATRINGRMGNIESDVGDLRVEVKMMNDNVTELNTNVSGLRAQMRESKNEMSMNLSIQRRTEEDQAKLDERLESLESIALAAKNILVFCSWIAGILIAGGGLIFGIYKYMKGEGKS